MIAARAPRARDEARLLIVRADGTMQHATRTALLDFVRANDVVVGNDAFTVPASLTGIHERSGQRIEVRLAATQARDMRDLTRCIAVVLGEGDFRMRTEDRASPPLLASGDRLLLGSLRATVERTLDHPRLIAVTFDDTASRIWSWLAEHGRPIQYAYLEQSLALWDTWTSIAGAPVAFETPSAGFLLDWQLITALRERDVAFTTLTHAAGISSTGDPELDRRLPLDEPYVVPCGTVRAIERTRERGGRVIAIGTTVVRALEHAARGRYLEAGPGVATQRIDATTRLDIVDAIVSGTHEPGSSHFELLRAFAADSVLHTMTDELERHGYRTHEFGDFILLQAAGPPRPLHSIPTHAPRSVARARCPALLLPA